MGCCQATPVQAHAEPHEIRAEESVFSTNEHALNYSHTPAIKIAEVIRKYTTDGALSVRQFNSMAHELRLNISEMDSLDSNVFTFYRYFREGKGFSAAKLTLLAAVLGSGSTREKLQVCWSALPNATDAEAPAASLRWMVDTLFSLAGEHLLLLSRGDPATNHRNIEESELRQTIDSFTAVKPQAASAVLQLLLGDSTVLSLQDAETRVVNNEKLKKIVKSDGLRSLLMESGKPETA